MNSKLRKLIGFILISPIILFLVGCITFAFYITLMINPSVLLGLFISYIMFIMFICGLWIIFND